MTTYFKLCLRSHQLATVVKVLSSLDLSSVIKTEAHTLRGDQPTHVVVITVKGKDIESALSNRLDSSGHGFDADDKSFEMRLYRCASPDHHFDIAGWQPVKGML